ncbi:restriction endonuclease subunit S [Staphylococcus epidermidis]|nr:restriction endonuclease subunit S [Staphylococcus epidermidis]MCG2530844.1 restriction endonuclease subunit S [Staphylococcus epidermidis]
MEYKKYKIEEIGTVVGGGTPSTKNPNYYGGNIPWITPKDLANYSKRYIQHGERNITDEGLKHSSAKLVPANAVLMTSRAPIGYLAIAANEVSTNQGFKSIVCNEKLVSPKFLYYLLQYEMKNIKSLGTGSTFSEISGKVVKNIEVNLPNIENQKKIETILDTIDEKIETNQHMIANLEELSQTLFKRWFVDFEFPDEDGNPYKSSGGEMVDSELGKIPSNWKIYKLKDIASHKKETFNPKKSEEVRVKHFSLPAYDNEEQAIEEEVNKIKSNKWIINNNCVLFSKMNPDTQRIWLPVIDNKKLNVASSEFVVMESPNNKINSFIYNICLNSQFIDYLKANTTGSTNSRQRVKPTIAVNYKLAVEDSIVKKYSEIITPYMEEMKILRSEIGKLTQLRDTLLPKLMSGELEIPDDMEVNMDELSI